MFFKWSQIVDSVKKKKKKSDSSNFVLLDHQLLENNRTLGIEKMNSKEIYLIITSSEVNISTYKIYLEKNSSL